MSSSSDTVLDDPQGPPHVHFMDPPTAYSSAKLGMWLFLATELLLFGVLFAAFAIFSNTYPAEFKAASQHLNWVMGGINTVILLVSSYFAAGAVTAAQKGDNKRVVKLLGLTLLCGFGFLIVKYFEYSHKYHIGLFPFSQGCNPANAVGECFSWNSPDFNEHFRMYFGLYYVMTGLHALHVVIGMILIAVWPLKLARKNRFSGKYYTPVENGALYWHLVDLIWIYLFPLLYLVE